MRGGVVDFYPAGAKQPVRLEFVGDTIESIRTYDPATQRSILPIDQAAIVPLQDLLSDGDGDRPLGDGLRLLLGARQAAAC